MKTILKISSCDSGLKKMYIRCNLAQKTGRVQVNYLTGNGWENTQYKSADARHTIEGLKEIALLLAAQAFDNLQVTVEVFN